MVRDSEWTAPWIAVVAALISVAAVIAERTNVLPIQLWALPVMAAFGAAVTMLVTLFQHNDSGITGHVWAKVYVYRLSVWVVAGAWLTWTANVGWHPWPVLTLVGGGAILVALSYLCRAPEATPMTRGADVDPVRDKRPDVVRVWESRIRQITKQAVKVTAVELWDNPANGCRVYVELPAETGMTTADLAGFCDRFAHAARLPQGCNVRALDTDRQGTAYLDVMLRDCLTDYVQVDPATSPVSINDEFAVMTSPRGERLNVCLRIMSMVIGGTTGSGKTTVLHRLIMWLARCVDALIWVVDLNGGGVAEPWIRAWACGEAARPVVDWVADNEPEAAALVAVANAIVKDRKTNQRAAARMRAANSTVLPVGADLPAVVVMTDEGGEVRQAVSVLGQLAAMGITRLAQIGRAGAGRVIMSVLRGTSDLTDKGLRVVAGLRLCLRMEEEDEYSHVLGTNPGRTRLLHTGSAYLRRPTDAKPIFGRTVDVPLDVMDRHAIACAPLRPDLDDRGRQVAARVRPETIMGGRAVPAEFAALQVMRDAAAGLVYENRWVRYAAKLAEMRGEDLDDDLDEIHVEPAPAPVAPGARAPEVLASGGEGVLDVWAAQVMGPPKPTLDPVAVEAPKLRLVEPVTTSDGTARDRILAMVDEAGPDGISTSEIKQSAGVVHSRVMDLLKQLREEGAVLYRDPKQPGVYVTPRHAQAA